MAIFYELSQHGMSHAHFTRAFVQMVAHALPDEPLTIYARQSHLDSAFSDPDPVLDHRLIQHPYLAPPDTAGFWAKTRHMLRFIRATYAPVRSARPHVVFLTGEPSHVLAAKLFRMMMPGFRCHLVLHGDIHSLRLPRSRNPLTRLKDYHAAISLGRHRDVRFIALETHIRTNIELAVPGSAEFVDVVRHPCMPVEVDWKRMETTASELRFGLLGIAGKSKGLDVYSRLALKASRGLRRRAQFRLIGKLQSGNDDLDLSGISGPLPFSKDWIPRPLFDEELARLHYVALPYNMDYYGLSASGVLLDVLRWRKPVIAFETPVLRELVDRFGEIGYLCQTEDDMAEVVNDLLENFDPERYDRQRRNLDAAYLSRLPDVAAEDYLNLGGVTPAGGELRVA